jgi:hypothetical protein
MPLNYATITDAIVEPVTLALAKAHCRIDPTFTEDDALVAIYIRAMRRHVEKRLGRALFNQTWYRTVDNFPLAASYDTLVGGPDRRTWPYASQLANLVTFDLPGGRTRKVNSITYLDGNGNTLTVDPTVYRTDLTSVPCRVLPAGNLYWPWQAQFLPGSVTLNYEVANYTAAVVGEAFTVPASGATTYQLVKLWGTGVERLVDGTGAAVAGATLATDPVAGTSTLTLPAALAGQALTIDYDVAALDEDIALAILELVGHAYRNPEATTDLKLMTTPLAVDNLLGPHAVTVMDFRPC